MKKLMHTFCAVGGLTLLLAVTGCEGNEPSNTDRPSDGSGSKLNAPASTVIGDPAPNNDGSIAKGSPAEEGSTSKTNEPADGSSTKPETADEGSGPK